MPRLYLVRHARPAAAWSEHPDPGIDTEGIRQAEEAASAIYKNIPSATIYSSPLTRCRETAKPLEGLWQKKATIIDAVSEIPSPAIEPHEKLAWLRNVSNGTWQEMVNLSPPGSPDFLTWRQSLLATLLALPADSVIFTHFVAINTAVAACLSIDQVLVFRPDHCSITIIEAVDGKLQLIEKGRESETRVLPGN